MCRHAVSQLTTYLFHIHGLAWSENDHYDNKFGEHSMRVFNKEIGISKSQEAIKVLTLE